MSLGCFALKHKKDRNQNDVYFFHDFLRYDVVKLGELEIKNPNIYHVQKRLFLARSSEPVTILITAQFQALKNRNLFYRKRNPGQNRWSNQQQYPMDNEPQHKSGCMQIKWAR